MESNGYFVISLDYELMWGVLDVKSETEYGSNITGVPRAFAKMLQLFEAYDIAVTVATVGFLFHPDLDALKKNIPLVLPEYPDAEMSPYTLIKSNSERFKNSSLYFNLELTEKLIHHPNIEIASHTYSHYYCLEAEDDKDAFKMDLLFMERVSKQKNINHKSIVFPRNQFTTDHIDLCREFNIKSYRGNPKHWIYKPIPEKQQGLLRRLFRLLDTYINITGHHCFPLAEINGHFPHNIAASRFLRPFSKMDAIIGNLKIDRIKRSMTFAAKNNQVYHLWWHPHNFGSNMHENLRSLEKIFKHYRYLNKTYSFQSKSMEGLTNKLSSFE